MSIRKIPFLVGEYYHIYNRGVDKRVIFLDNYDYRRFMVLLYLCNNTNSIDMRDILNKGKAFVELFSMDKGENLVDIGVYCPMPNHFHILLREKVDGGISSFIQKISTAYSMYFNGRYERTGSLFEGKFKAKHIDTEEYLNWMFSYLHTNPVKLIEKDWKEKGISNPEKVKEFIKNYKYSSYHDYFIGDRPESVILNKDAFPEHFAQLNDFEDIVKELDVKDFDSK